MGAAFGIFVDTKHKEFPRDSLMCLEIPSVSKNWRDLISFMKISSTTYSAVDVRNDVAV